MKNNVNRKSECQKLVNQTCGEVVLKSNNGSRKKGINFEFSLSLSDP